jgi:hypothetical protein
MKNTRIKRVAIAILALILMFTSALTVQTSCVSLTSTSEYQMYVHNIERTTYIQKPMFPVYLNSSQIPIGQNWTVVCPLLTNHSYHVYCYGSWVNMTSAAKTDYDIYVYNPEGQLESEHTEAAGFPEHLGTRVNDALFTPAEAGNYTFTIVNDVRESKGAQQATFMIIENLECDVWQTHHAEGTDSSGSPSLRTCWAYEFMTNESSLQLWVKVPNTLDMYEARLYLMNRPDSLTINGFPLPWEPGLYGNKSDVVGGYNFENEGYRGVAYASCEYKGQDMFLNYTSTSSAVKLYQLVFIGEVGSGDLDFLIKTRFNGTVLTPITVPKRVYPNSQIEVAYASNASTLENAKLLYTNDNWETTVKTDMAVENRTCNVTLPGQAAGTFIQYEVDASDVLKNNLTVSGSFPVKFPAVLNITAQHEVTIGDNITVTGTISPLNESVPVSVVFSGVNTTEKVECAPSENGTFTASFLPDMLGPWDVHAESAETGAVYGCVSLEVIVSVVEPPFYVTYMLYIVGGVVGGIVAGVAVYLRKFRNRG